MPPVGPTLITLYTNQGASKWFGVACSGEALVATAVGVSRARVISELRRSLPPRAAHRVGGEDLPPYVASTMALLVELEAGEERRESFTLSAEHVPEPLARVVRIAAAIPLGYVTSYGDIARLAGTDARDVGRVMATNPLYPIVACHRVVGADLSLVGYAGSKADAALQAKLARLSRETRGFTAEKRVPVDGGGLRLYPVEWAISRAEASSPREDRQRKLFADPPPPQDVRR